MKIFTVSVLIVLALAGCRTTGTTDVSESDLLAQGYKSVSLGKAYEELDDRKWLAALYYGGGLGFWFNPNGEARYKRHASEVIHTKVEKVSDAEICLAPLLNYWLGGCLKVLEKDDLQICVYEDFNDNQTRTNECTLSVRN